MIGEPKATEQSELRLGFARLTGFVRPIQQLRVVLTREDWRQLLLLLAAMVLVTAFQVTGVASILPFMHLVSQPGVVTHNEWMRWAYELIGFESERRMLFWTAVLVFCLFTTSVAMTALIGWHMQRAIWATTHRLCLRLLRTYMQLPYEFFLENSSSVLLRRIVADVNRFLTDVLLAGSQLLAQTILAAGLIGLMFYLHAGITLMAMAVLGGTYTVIQIMRHTYLERLGQERIDVDDQRYTSFIDAITGIKSIRADGATEFFFKRFGDASAHYARLYPRLDLLINVPRHLMEIVAFGGILLLVVIFVGSERAFTELVPTLSLFALATYRLMPALHTIFDNAARLSTSLPVIESLAKDLEPSSQTLRGSLPLAEETKTMVSNGLSFEREIHLQDLNFRYTGARLSTLENVNIRIRKGSRVAFVGATGSGKTTLIDLAVGLLTPSSGALLVDGQVVRPENVTQWRQCIAYVPQDVFLFDDTIANNITFGDRTDDRQRLQDATRIAQLDEFVENELDDGYETAVGERGVRLSGGERQRIGIARALYRRPGVLLLDEATSALDNKTEAGVMSALEQNQPDITVISIAHRLSTVRNYDRIFFLEHGKVIDEGTYSELYARNATFRSMVDASSGDNAIPSAELLPTNENELQKGAASNDVLG